MDRVVEQSAALDAGLLAQNEEQYEKTALDLVTRLNDISIHDLAAAKDDLEALSPSAHTILYVYVLLASIETSAGSGKAAPRQLPNAVLPEGSLWPPIAQVLLEFDPIQARFCGAQLLRIVDYVAVGAEQTMNYVPALQLLHHFILRLDPTSSALTSTHRTFIRLCLLSQAYTEAVDILDRPIYHIPTPQLDLYAHKYICSPSAPNWTYLSPAATGLTQDLSSRTCLEYFLLGGMCYMALGRYRDAFFFLEVALTAPAVQNVASSVMIEAYKKWLLVGLLLNGVAPSIPSAASPTAMKHIRAVAKPYESVAMAFKGGDIARLWGEIEAGSAIWQDEGNYGLVVEVFQAFRKFSVCRLGKTFAALSVVEIARRTSPEPADVEETKAYLEGLMASGELKAVITDSAGGDGPVLRFLPASASSRSETAVETAFASRTLELRTLLHHVRDTEHRMEISREYVDYLKKLKKARDDEKKSGGTDAGRARVVDDVDEDMMEEF